MNAPRTIPHDVLLVQREASDPSVSAWVSANAGSGKTHVLAQRVIRLLLEGTDPGKILCLTFTKAAAANMANRVFTTLAKWTTLDDAALDREIHDVGARSDGERRAAARRLFACALETPGGLKIQTIHGFCARLLQQFPFEAHVAARFRVLEETQQRQLLERLRLSVLLEAAAKPDGALGRALAAATTAASDFAFKDALDEAIGKRDEVMAFVDAVGGTDGIRPHLSQSLGVSAANSVEEIEREIVESPLLPAAEWGAVADACSAGSQQDQRPMCAAAQGCGGCSEQSAQTLICRSSSQTKAQGAVRCSRRRCARSIRISRNGSLPNRPGCFPSSRFGTPRRYAIAPRHCS